MLLVQLALILISTKIAAILSRKMGQPAVLGQIVMGILLGPSLFRVVHTPAPFLAEMGEIGVIMLMFIAGLDTELRDLKEAGKASSLAAVGGVILPMILGYYGSRLFGYSVGESLFVGTILTATSVSISVQTLLEIGKLRSKEGMTILGAAVIDDVLGILVLSLVAGLSLGGANIPLLLAKMVIFFAGAGLFGIYILPKLVDLFARLELTEGRVTFALSVCFVFAWLAEQAGLAAIIGAYTAGILVGTTFVKNIVLERLSVVAYTIFVPVFFVNIGMSADIHQLDGAATTFIAFTTIIAIIGKVIGCALGSRIAGQTLKEALRVGVGMISRGEVALIVASLGLDKGLIQKPIFSAAVIVVLVTTLATPPLLSLVFGKEAVPEENWDAGTEGSTSKESVISMPPEPAKKQA